METMFLTLILLLFGKIDASFTVAISRLKDPTFFAFSLLLMFPKRNHLTFTVMNTFRRAGMS